MGLYTGAGYTGAVYAKAKTKTRDIFCDECKHYKKQIIHNGDVVKNGCFHPYIFNRSRYVNSTPITRGFMRKWTYPGKCECINADNTCELLEKIHIPDRTVS